eukprot:g68123.t1
MKPPQSPIDLNGKQTAPSQSESTAGLNQVLAGLAHCYYQCKCAAKADQYIRAICPRVVLVFHVVQTCRHALHSENPRPYNFILP